MKYLKVMCDYCADGLWIGGVSITSEYLYEDLGFNKKQVKLIAPLIKKWQYDFECLNLWDISSKEIEESQGGEPKDEDFKAFNTMGLIIFQMIDDINPDRDNITVIYYDEIMNTYSEIVDNKIITITKDINYEYKL